MWDSGYMADIDNLTEINENFDTVKTLLNSIRAQGILNTSDVDKLLSGINAKLEKINTEEDIDLIKVFLTELKQNLDERHNILISKFGAIEALFSNLLKNSNELPKSSELKELFDIVATNLSVFSREVVAQKESITDITLRLDAIRSDDSQKKDIIKNITLLKPDLERLTNGFDTIVISLNDNFKTLAKTISGINQSEQISKFSDDLNNIEMSSNTILSALQLLDKKTETVDESIKNLVTKSDLENTSKNIDDLKYLNQGINDTLKDMNGHYERIDNLADKIDASVSIIAGLKSMLEDSDNQNTQIILDKINLLDAKLSEIRNDTEFEEFKSSLTSALRELSESSDLIDKNLSINIENTNSIIELLRALDINSNFSSVLSAIENGDTGVKDHIDEKIQSFTNISESNLSKILDNISVNADALSTRISQNQSEITTICEGNFNSVFENIAELKKIVGQLDENGVSSNNAMFSNISDRLTMFETALKESLEIQETTTNKASTILVEQVENIKNLSNVLDYKMDSSVVEVSNMTRMFETLKNSVDGVLALNFVETVKDLRADVYATKQDLTTALENSGATLAENVSNDLYGKYELLISKLDYVEEEFKKSQTSALTYIKDTMEKISSSIVDIISYVSESKAFPMDEFDKRIEDISDALKNTNLDYVESVRDVVDVIRAQVENNLKSIDEDSAKRFEYLNRTVENNTEGIKSDIKTSYDKILEIQKLNDELKEILDINSTNNNNKFDALVANISDLNGEFENKVAALKASLLEKITEFQNEVTCENADNIKEFKFATENLYSKNTQDITDALEGLKVKLESFASENNMSNTTAFEDIANNINELKSLITVYSTENSEKRANALENIDSNFQSLKSSIQNLANETHAGRQSGIEKLINEINGIKEHINTSISALNDNESLTLSTINANYENIKSEIEKLADENSGSRTNALSKLLENFVGLKEFVQALNTKTSEELTQKTNNMLECFESVKAVLNKVDENVDGDMTRQLSIIESNFESLISQMTILNEKAEQSLVEMINDEYKTISGKIDINVSNKLEEYKSIIEETFENLANKAESQSSYLQERISDINSVMKSVWAAQSEQNIKQIDEIADRLRGIIQQNADLTSVDYTALRERLDEFTKDLSTNNEILIQNLKAQLDDMTKYVDSVIDIQTQESDAHIDEFVKRIETLTEKNTNTENKLAELNNSISSNVEQTWARVNGIKAAIDEKAEQFETLIDNLSSTINDKSAGTQSLISDLSSQNKNIVDSILSLSDLVSNKSANTQALISDLSAQNEDVKNSILSLSDSVSNRSANTQALISDLSAQNEDVRDSIVALSDTVLEKSSGTQNLISGLSGLVQENTDNINKITAETSAAELKAIEDAADRLYEQLELEKQTVLSIKTFISDTLQNKLKSLSGEIEKETDIIVSELVEQFESIRKAQQDSAIQITTGIESIIESQIYNNIEDLKSYLDIKTDSSVITEKLDNLKVDITASLETVISDMNKMLEADAFTTAISDYRMANEIMVNSAVDRINEKIAGFIADASANITDDLNSQSKSIENKLALFDKKFIDTIVDKFEEIKLISNKYNESFDNIEKAVDEVLHNFTSVRIDVGARIEQLSETVKLSADNTNTEIRKLNECLENLRSQISNKSFDEAFQASINKQIYSLEKLIKEQYESIEEISDMCGMNLPDVSELNTIVKGSVIDSLNNLTEKLKGLDDISNLVVSTADNLSEQIDAQNIEESIETALKNTKSDIITQFLNIFNQISFVAEQEEILDFIQERHDELIKVLSHIVTSTNAISNVRDTVVSMDDKISTIKDEINSINEKINNIISSDDEIDYIYSLQDLETDIANLRIVLKEMKDHTDGYGNEFNTLMASTENVYKLVESIKDELPDKKSFDSLTEDIVSISTRTNKLILASDESYKTLKDNLHDFKLVIDDLDERTRNFAEESGMNRVDAKLNALNTMVQNGAKINQVFNEVFEYLAEWVDNAGNQISAISNKVNTLDEIEQIKTMLADLKAEAEDNSENVELIEALGNVFDKQAKKITALETKLDKIIVESTINNQKNKLDLTPMENTLNSFLAAIGDKMSYQQEKIDMLESKLEKVVDILDEKDTAALTKKMGGMDKQIAKLNKSIEKIASHVIEK